MLYLRCLYLSATLSRARFRRLILADRVVARTLARYNRAKITIIIMTTIIMITLNCRDFPSAPNRTNNI